MRSSLRCLLLALVVCGCRSETARPVPVEGSQHQPTISAGTTDEQPPPDDAATDEEQMSPEKARKTVHQAVVKNTGVQDILGVKAQEEEADVFSSPKALTEEEMKALEEALGAVEKKPPPPMKSP